MRVYREVNGEDIGMGLLPENQSVKCYVEYRVPEEWDLFVGPFGDLNNEFREKVERIAGRRWFREVC